MLYLPAAAREKKSSHSGANGSGPVVRNIKASFLVGLGFGSTREASSSRDWSSASSSADGGGSGSGGGGAAAAAVRFLLLGCTGDFLGASDAVSKSWLLLVV